jgi:hypothetical protein
MKRRVLAVPCVLAVLSFLLPAPTGAEGTTNAAPAAAAKPRNYGTYCAIEPEFRDNVSLSSDVDHAGLRIGQKGKLRIFVTNTAKMDLIDVALQADSDAFDIESKPEARWAEFPDLKTMRKGGKPQAFEVTLTRKPGTPDGDHDVKFGLLNLKNRPVVSAPLDALAKAPIELTRANVTVDGRIDEAEWGTAPLCTALCDYRTLYPFNKIYGLVLGYEVSKIQTRLRAAADDTRLFFCVDFLELPKCASDVVSIYVAASLESEPVEITIDRLKKTCTTKAGDAGIKVAADEAGRVFEVEVPRKLLGLEKAGAFYADFARVINTGAKDKPGQRYTRFLCDAENPDPTYSQKPGLRLAADTNNVYCKLNFEEIARKTRTNLTEVAFYMLPEGPIQGNPIPRRFILDTRKQTVSCTDEKVNVAALKYEVAGDGKTATLAVPRNLTAVEGAQRFFVYAHFLGEDRSTNVEPIRSYWRGNEYSVTSPYVYEKFVMPN